MGDDPKQPRESGDDLLSKLFEDDPEGTELGIEASPQKSQKVVASGAASAFGQSTRPSDDRVSQTEFLKIPKTQAVDGQIFGDGQPSATELQFKPEQLSQMMEEQPLSDDAISFFGQKSTATEAEEKPDSTMVLDTNDLVLDSPKAPAAGHDPIDEALAAGPGGDFSSVADSEDALNLDAPSEISSSDFSPKSAEEFADQGLLQDQKSEVKAEDFAEVFSQEPIQVSSGGPDKAKSNRLPWKSLAKAAGVLIPLIGGFVFLYSSLTSDKGLWGRRLEGLSLVRAYRPPTEVEVAEFEQIFKESDSALLSDAPSDVMALHTKLQSVLEKDERHGEAIGRKLEHGALLIQWYGTGSPWAKTFDDDMAVLTQMGKSIGKYVDNIFVERAKARRLMAVGDSAQAKSILEKSIERFGDSSDMSHLTMAELAWQSEDPKTAESSVDKVKDKASLRARYWTAKIKGQAAEIGVMGREGYLPARIEDLALRVSVADAEKSADLIRDVEKMQKDVADYPSLVMILTELRGDLLQAGGKSTDARKTWRELTSESTRRAELWQKIARSAEADALWDDALEAYQQLEKVGLLSEKSLTKYVELLRVRGRLVDAGNVVSRGLEKFKQSASLLTEQGRIAWELFQVDAAKEAFQKALAVAENYEPAVLGLVEMAMQRRDFLEATQLLKKISPQSAQYPQSLVTMARLELQRGSPSQAEENFKKALKASPKLEEVYPALVDLYLRQERDSEAESLLGSAPSTLASSPYIALSRARLLQFQRKPAEALDVLAPALKSHDHLHGLQLLQVDLLMDAGKTMQAAQGLASLSAKQLRDPELGYLRAKLYFVDAQASSQDITSGEVASKVLDAAIRQSDQERFRLLLAKVALQLGEKPVVQEQIDATLRLNSKSASAIGLQGDLAMDAGNYEAAARAYKSALQHTRFRTDLYSKLAEAFKQLNQPGQALQYYQRVTAERPQDAQAHLELGKLYNAEGRYQGALNELKKAVRLDSKLAEAYYFLGFVQKELGDERNALKSFEEFLSLKPDSTESATIRDEVYFLKNGGSGN